MRRAPARGALSQTFADRSATLSLAKDIIGWFWSAVKFKFLTMPRRRRDLNPRGLSLPRTVPSQTRPKRRAVKRKKPKVSTRDGVLRVLIEHQGQPFSVRQLLEALTERGWLAPDLRQPRNTVLEATKRAMDLDERIRRVEINELAHFVWEPSIAWQERLAGHGVEDD